MIQTLLARVGAVLGSVVLTLILLEVLLRVVSPGSLYNQNIRVYDKDVGYRFEKNLDTVVDTGKGPHKIVTNSLGYIGRDVPIPKPEGVLRIANFGDSYAEGVQEVDWDKNFVALLAPELESRVGQKVESINFGFSGRGTQEAYWAYTQVAKDLSPDVVVLWFTIANDFANNYVPERPGAQSTNKSGSIKLILKKSALATFVFERVKGNESALRFMRTLGLTNAVITEDSADTPSFENQINYGLSENIHEAQKLSYATTEDLLRAFSESTKEANTQFVVVVIPQFTDVDAFKKLFEERYRPNTAYDFTKAERELRAMLEKLGITHYVLREDLLEYERGEQICGGLWGDHYSACGHDVTAKLVASYLSSALFSGARP